MLIRHLSHEPMHDITELLRKQTGENTFDMIYHVKGKRFFGAYEVIIHVRAIDAGAAGVIYTAQIHAYPHNGAFRFFARRFGSIERYFKKKTRLIESISNQVLSGLCESSAGFKLDIDV